MKMKKFLAAVSSLVMLGAFTACGDSSSNESTNNNSNNNAEATTKADDAATEADAGADNNNSAAGKTVGIAMPTKSLERWNRDGEYLKSQFEAAGYSVELKYSDNNDNQQNNDIQGMIADKVDLLLIAAIDGSTLSQTLADAKDAGIPVIAYDRLIMNTDAVSYYVSFDNYTVGKLQGEYVVEALDLDNATGPFNIEFTAGDPADNNAGFFFNGAYDAVKKYIDDGKLNIPSGKKKFEQVATAQWSTDTALANMQNTLASYYSDGTQLDVALCSNDSTALGVAQAISSDYNGKNVPIVTGQDGDIANLKNIVDGKQSMTVYKNVSDEAGVTLEVSKAILSGQTPDASLLDSLSAEATYDTSSYDNGVKTVPSYLLVPYVITKDNLDKLVDTGLYQWDSANKYLESTASTT
ncbi:putative multiple sugar transport system substrate-binding protein [Ruminococcus flavefaciens]|uniref:Putative multiple sugar transport system substrate-binding protein n=1 Tax=Ruminococcus flavefaciens TaxID=1265 RepID=A0A1H6L4S2_RUMFL|nr:sugar-binding protein [Ruminococcus flavefaciens]SEH79310.1 putative multiple sugar transport system substrate-binding protein [Ruminococcus flavefaciens]